MDTKLTLKLDTGTIERAKEYAKAKKVSLSSLVENYLNFVITKENEPNEITPLVKSLSGVTTLPESFDEKQSYREHVLDKYDR